MRGTSGMDATKTEGILDALAREVPGAVLLWRGPRVDGSDVDLLVAEGRDHDVMRALRAAGLTPAPQADGRLVWRSLDEAAVVIDTLPARAWSASYPPLADVTERSRPGPAGLPAASPEDRLLILSAEAIAGHPLEKVAGKAEQSLAEAGARERVLALGSELGESALARLIADPDRLRRLARGGRLPYSAALRAALRSPRARMALRGRVARRLGLARRLPVPAARPGQRGVLVALSGMDGSGKSSAALELAARLEQRGRPTVVTWNRFAAESALLDLIAAPVRRMLRRKGPIADPVATDGAPGDDAGHEAPGPPARRGPVAWVWVVVVAAANARSCRRAAALRRRGVVVVCDRWLADALVDLEVRYGRHPAAEWVLRRAVPRPDVAVLLQIDAATSAQRKPGDQAASVLAAMARRYGSLAGEVGSIVAVDASRGRDEVAADVEAAVMAAL
jgi:thymidylate kinase